MNRRFRFAGASDDESTVIDMMRRESLRQIPVLDDEGKVVRLLCLPRLTSPEAIDNPVVIMAGGKVGVFCHSENCLSLCFLSGINQC